MTTSDDSENIFRPAMENPNIDDLKHIDPLLKGNYSKLTYWTVVSLAISVIALILKLAYIDYFYSWALFYVGFALVGIPIAIVAFFRILFLLFIHKIKIYRLDFILQLLIAILPFLIIFMPEYGLISTVSQPSYGFEIDEPNRFVSG